MDKNKTTSAVLTFRTLTLFILLFGCVPGLSRAKSRVTSLVDTSQERLHYEVMGSGRTIVFVHGGLVDSRMWDEQFKEFAKHYKVIRYDLRGFGKSSFPTRQYSHVDDLHNLLELLRIEKASIVGLSLGGMIATDFALEHPEMVEALILAGSALRGYQYKSVGNRQAIFQAAANEGVDKAVAMWMDDPVFVTAKKYPAAQARMRKMLTDNFKAWSSIPPNLLTWPARLSIERLSSIMTPTLIVVGDQDNPNILDIAEVLSTKIVGARKMVIEEAGHHLNMEKPREFNKKAFHFLKGSLSRSPNMDRMKSR